MAEHKCPENLRELLINLDATTFEGLSAEVISANELTRLLRAYTNRSARELEQITVLSRRSLTQGKEILARLFQYGNNRNGIIEGLNGELDLCDRCQGEYDMFLDGVMHIQKLIGKPFADKKDADKHYLGRYLT